MRMRTSSKTVVFTRPFLLAGLGIQPAGAVVVETHEELLEGVAFPTWRRHSTVIRLCPMPGLTLTATIDPEELKAALVLDGAPPGRRRESLVRSAHRSDMKLFLDAARPNKAANPDA